MSSTPSQKDVEASAAPQTERKNELQDQTAYLPTKQVIWVFLAATVRNLAVLLDETMVSVALPVIGQTFNATSQISWVPNAYYLTSTAFQLLYGRISDIWSRKTVIIVLLAIFFFANLASALSKTFVQLLVFRAIAGIGGGGVPTIGQIIVSDVVSLRERGKYQGILGASVALSYGIGPVIGGAFVAAGQWRWVFWLTLPLTVIAAGAVAWMPLRPIKDKDVLGKLKKIDFLGSAFILSATTLILVPLTWGGGEYAWTDAHVIAPLVVGVLLGMGFVLWEWKGPRFPLMPLHVFKNRVVVGAIATQTINGWLTVVQVFLLPTFYQLAYRYSPVKSGAMVLPITVTQTITSSLTGFYISHTGRYRELIVAGWALWAIGLGLMTTLPLEANSTVLSKQVGYSLIVGMGVGQTFQPALVALQGAVERKEMATVTSLRSFVRSLGGTVGLSVCGAIIDKTARSYSKTVDLTNPTEDTILGYYKGFRIVFYVLTGLASFGFILAATLMINLDLDRDDDEEMKEEGRKVLQRWRRKRGKGTKDEKPHTAVNEEAK
ncbi:MFS general substrate transporter, partial [Flagelloscypha sp. PMI_526]